MTAVSPGKGALSDLIDRVIAVCPLPASAQRVLQLTSDPEVEIKEVGRVLSTDPALAAEVMRLANSAAYSRGVPSTDLVQAILKLGLEEMRQMAGAMAILAAFPTETEFSTTMRTMSVLSGAIARDVAQKTQLANVGTAYVCGLLAEVGAMACTAIDGGAYVELRKQCGDDWERRTRRERERYGYASPAIGSALLARNNLPREITLAVAASIDTPDSMSGALACLTVFARHAAPLLLAAAPRGEETALDEPLGALAKQTGQGSVAPAELRALCLHAASATVNALADTARR